MCEGISSLRLVGAVIGLLSLTYPSSAAAQGGEQRWASKDGQLTLQIPASWQEISKFVGTDALLAIGPPAERGKQQRRNLGICSVTAEPVAGTVKIDQATLNSRVASLNERAIAAVKALTIHSSDSVPIAGIQVAGLDIDYAGAGGARARLIQRNFYLAGRDGAVHYTVGCGASGSAYGSSDVPEMLAFVASLTLKPEISH